LGTSLKTTNCLESINALVGRRTDKVDHWRTSDQKQRWLAAALVGIEPRLRRIKGYRSLPLLRAALQAEIREKETTVRHHAAKRHVGSRFKISTKNGLDWQPMVVQGHFRAPSVQYAAV
jgi:transposase-like protein